MRLTLDQIQYARQQQMRNSQLHGAIAAAMNTQYVTKDEFNQVIANITKQVEQVIGQLTARINSKQDQLVDNQNIMTINGHSLLQPGNFSADEERPEPTKVFPIEYSLKACVIDDPHVSIREDEEYMFLIQANEGCSVPEKPGADFSVENAEITRFDVDLKEHKVIKVAVARPRGTVKISAICR